MPRATAILPCLLLALACADPSGSADVGPAAVADRSAAAVPTGSSGRPRVVTIQGNDSAGRPVSRGGPTVTVQIVGTNPGTAVVTDLGDGRWTASDTPIRPGFDTLLITMDGVPIGGSPHATVVEMAARGTATIDGRLDAGEWATASTMPLFQLPALAGSMLLVMNDGQYLYLGVRTPLTDLAPQDGVSFRIDNTLDSLYTVGDDTFSLRGDGTIFDRFHNGANYVGDRDVIVGDGVVTIVGNEAHWEIRRPLQGGSDDLNVSVGARIGLCMSYLVAGGSGTSMTTPSDCVLSIHGQRRYVVVRLLAP
jgi:hypothetical protein